MSKPIFVPETRYGGTVRTDVATLSDNLIVGNESRIGATKGDVRTKPVTCKSVDRNRDLRNCFSYSK